jgi:Na+/proline symporter
MNSSIILVCLLSYFVLLFAISLFTGKKADNKTFFSANKASPWYLVAFGMIGASLSGITFISVPGWVGKSQFSYMQMVLGYIPGYLFVAYVLLPIYYKLNLTTIYTYLNGRFGVYAYKTGSAFFLLSRLLGSSLRMYLTVNILQFILFDSLQIPFALSVFISFALIWLYTFRGGIKTIVWTDTLQTLTMLFSLVATFVLIGQSLHWSFFESFQQIAKSSYSQIFFFDDLADKRNFFKLFISGALIAIVMTGLDQDMMQKNLTCRNLKDAQKNMVTFSFTLVFVNLLFLGLGVLLFLYTEKMGLAFPEKADELFASIAIGGTLPAIVGLLFVLGLVAAAYSSADSAIAALTTSFCVDILGFERKNIPNNVAIRMWVQVLFSVLSIIIILVFKQFHNDSLIDTVFKVASYTYGPLLGIFAFGIFTKHSVYDKAIPLVALMSPIICYVLDVNSKVWFDYSFGYELLLINGGLTFFGIYLFKRNDG